MDSSYRWRGNDVHDGHAGDALGVSFRVSPMRAGLDLDTLFAIEDAASARLMLVKASCLRKAGVIDEAEAAAIFRRANAILFPLESSQAA